MTDQKTIRVECCNCKLETNLPLNKTFESAREWYNKHKTRIGRIGCRLDDILFDWDSLLAHSQAQAREEERERIFQAISTDGGDFCKKVYKALGIKTSGDAERPNLLASAEGDK